MEEFPVILFPTSESWAEWLEINGNLPGLWVRIAKKGSNIQSISYDEALNIALCYGWIDGLKKTWDKDSWIQRFTPRKPKSNWSRINREKAEKFIAEGKMKPQGFKIIELAKESGTWDNAYDSQSNSKIPDDFREALEKNPDASDFFKTLESVNRYAILYRIQTTKTQQKRAEKISGFIEMLNKKEKIHNVKNL
jgi:uncharacterized protein YdeI (YjbR/CyaY-like superfamily)